MSGNSTPINLNGSVNNLVKYYPSLLGCTPNYDNANYSINFGEQFKAENSNTLSQP